MSDLIPRWDLSSVFAGFDADDYKSALKEVEVGCEKLNLLLESTLLHTDFSAWLDQWYRLQNKTGALYESLYAFTEAVSSTDTTDTVAMNNVGIVEKLGLLVDETDRKFSAVLSENKDKLEDFYSSKPEYKDYRFVIQEKIQSFSHQMKLEEENLAQDLQRTGGNAWSRLQGSIIANLVDPETGKTFNQLRNEAYSADAEVRKTAYDKELALLKSAEIPLAACLNNLKGETITLNARRSWQSPLDRSLATARISRKSLEALIGAIEDSLPFWQDYLKTKAALLDDGDALPFYDLFAPLTDKTSQSEPEKIWTFDEARSYIIERFSSFSAKMGDFARRAFDQHWIDAEVRKGKVGGAYCTSFPAHKESRVLTNFTGSFNNITTLAHELGHAYHHECIKDADYALMSYPMTLAETASIFSETIVMKDILSRASGFDQVQLCETHLSDANQVLVDILSRFYFERQVFEERKIGELSAADFCRIMTDAQNNTYGAGLSSVKHPYMWALKVHYYSPDFDFYNYPYAFGQLFGLGLYSVYQKEGPAFAERYEKLLVQTGRASCEDVCAAAGFDITGKEFWQGAIAQYKSELDVLKAWNEKR